MARIREDSIKSLKDAMDIVDVVEHFMEIKKSGANFKAPCPFHEEKSASFIISPSKQIYHCFGCGAGGDAIKFVMEYEKVDFKEAVEKVAAISNFTLQYEDNIQRRHTPIVKQQRPKKTIEYKVFDPAKTKHSDIEAGKSKYMTLSSEHRMMIVYSDIWEVAYKNKDAKAKFGFGKSRCLNLRHKEFKELGYIPAQEFHELEQTLKERYPLEDLILFGVINDQEHKKPYSFKLHYIEKGGLLVYPSFHVYATNVVTGFMFRPTHPPQWMIDSKMKEVQMTNRDILESLPYGLTNEFIQNKNAIKCVVEGGPDAHCSPEQINDKDLLFMSIPGTQGFKEEYLGYLKGDTLRFMLDPDRAGQTAFFGTIKLVEKQSGTNHLFLRDKSGTRDFQLAKDKLRKERKTFEIHYEDGYLQKCRKAGICVEVGIWDSVYGDLNDVKKSIDKNGIPCKDMEDFYINIVKVKRWCVDRNTNNGRTEYKAAA